MPVPSALIFPYRAGEIVSGFLLLLFAISLEVKNTIDKIDRGGGII
jgi:hypothetical protein